MRKRYSELTEIIYQNPGIHFNELVRASGIKNGVLSHYLENLVNNRIVSKWIENKRTMFFSPKVTKYEMTVINQLRKKTVKNIIFALIKYKNLEFSKIVKITGKSPSNVSRNLSKMLYKQLVLKRTTNSKTVFCLKNTGKLLRIIEKYHL